MSSGFGLTQFGLAPFGDPVVIPFVLATGVAGPVENASGFISNPGVSGSASLSLSGSGSVSYAGVSGSANPVNNVGGGVI